MKTKKMRNLVAGDKRRSAENLEVKTLDYFVNICLTAEHSRDSCLIALLFLSGRRISELMALHKKDIVLTKEFLSVTTFNEKTFRYAPKKDYLLEQEGEYLQYFKDEHNNTFTIPKTVRYYPKIQIDVSTSTPLFRELGHFIVDHITPLQPNDYLFPRFKGEGHISSGMAYKIVRFLAPDTWPHWYRHQRFTQVYTTVKSKMKDPFDVVMTLHDFTKHRSLDTTMNYIHHLKLKEIKKEI